MSGRAQRLSRQPLEELDVKRFVMVDYHHSADPVRGKDHRVMLRKFAPLATALVCVALTSACLLDPKEAPPDVPRPTPSGKFYDLTEIWHPLNNLEQAYGQRNIERYAEALDSVYYTFFFSAADFSSGNTDESWTYEVDTGAAGRMFDAQLPDISKRAVNLEFDLIFNPNSIVWSEVIPGDPPNETWQTATISYTFYIKLGDGVREFVQSPGASAQITVRQFPPGDGKWRIVQIFDLPGL
jgi:hypothetical protein